MSDPYDWFAPMPDLQPSFKMWNERYWAKQPAWKRRLRPIIERGETIASKLRSLWRKVRWALRWPRTPPVCDNWCHTLCDCIREHRDLER